jgi:hypothetical protein
MSNELLTFFSNASAGGLTYAQKLAAIHRCIQEEQ